MCEVSVASVFGWRVCGVSVAGVCGVSSRCMACVRDGYVCGGCMMNVWLKNVWLECLWLECL